MLSNDAQLVLTGVATLSLAASVGLAVNGVRKPRAVRDAFEATAEALSSIATPPEDPKISALLELIDAPAKDTSR
jgi:hypothetical protein